MRAAYRVLACLVALEVVVQAGVPALAFSGLVHWVAGDRGPAGNVPE